MALFETPAAADIIERALLARRGAGGQPPFVLGICGAQGSGKSTVAAALETRLAATGLRAATLSLDDLYLPIGERERLARDVHPLLRTRGVPGTHDVALGHRVIDALGRDGPVALPRFDKARDTRSPIGAWPVVEAPVDVLLFEGWCVGAIPQAPEALAAPVNDLERLRDEDGRWRDGVNAALGGAYRTLFDRIDMLALLVAPNFGIVRNWRIEQEHMLAACRPEASVMSDGQVAAFVAYYERLTRHMLAEMPGRADVTIRLDRGRRVVGVEYCGGTNAGSQNSRPSS